MEVELNTLNAVIIEVALQPTMIHLLEKTSSNFSFINLLRGI